MPSSAATGLFSRFYNRDKDIAELAECTEFRIRQLSFDLIVVEIGGRENLTPEEVTNVTAFLQARAGDEFKINAIARPAIDWGNSVKRQSFNCEV